MGAYRDSSADFRVLYKLSRTDSSNVEQTFELFPGFDNMTDTDGDGFGDKLSIQLIIVEDLIQIFLQVLMMNSLIINLVLMNLNSLMDSKLRL